tara:strand:- start:56 stop:1378 length:1323 start_codon:yes stop_codon:yes gene_type:complete
MSSVITTLDDVSSKDVLGTVVNTPIYIQFVPGYCVEVIHSKDNSREKGDASINTIIAIPHIKNPDVVYNNKKTAEESYRYFPLFRTSHDVPSKGDPVLLCTIGKTNYYMGPLNTINNNPTWNDDLNYTPEKIFENDAIGDVTERGVSGESPNFDKSISFKRLIKKRKEELDGYAPIENETTGDYLIEGRHGNSLRIGSRSTNPYVFISNQRSEENYTESLADGCLISITSDGTLAQHFGGFLDEKSEKSFDGFVLASDILSEDYLKGTMSDLITSIPENGEQNAQELIYNYSDNQILFQSDRITLNSKLDDIYLSSRQDIHIGTGRHLTISTNNNFIITSEKIFFGNPVGREPKLGTKDSEIDETIQKGLMQPMVLGATLLSLLKETLEIIKGAQGLCQGAPLPLADETGAPGGVNAKITQIEQKIDQILSNKHFIEPNT